MRVCMYVCMYTHRRGGLQPDTEPTHETFAAHEKGRETAGEAGNRITERVLKRHDMPRVNNQLLAVFQLVPLHSSICSEIDLARQPCSWGLSLLDCATRYATKPPLRLHVAHGLGLSRGAVLARARSQLNSI